MDVMLASLICLLFSLFVNLENDGEKLMHDTDLSDEVYITTAGLLNCYDFWDVIVAKDQFQLISVLWEIIALLEHFDIQYNSIRLS